MRKIAAFLALSALAGCNLAPPYRQPPPPVAATFPDAVAGQRQAVDIGWREFFVDPQLQAYIAAALANNRDLAQSVARIAQARAQYRIQDAARLPELDAQAYAYRAGALGSGPVSVPATGGTGTGGTGTGGTGTGGTGTGTTGTTSSAYNQFSLGVAVPSFELDFWGRVRNLAEAARREYLATIEAERAFRLSLISQVAATYLDIRSGEERIALAQRTVASRSEGLRIAKLRLDAGVTSTVDYDQAALLVTQAQTDLAELQRTTDQSRNLLTVLTGGPVAGPLPAPRTLEDQGQFTALDAGLPSALLVNRPDILAAEQRLRAANANIGAARAAFLPSISLTGALGFISSSLSSLISTNSLGYQASGSALLPIFDWGKRSAQLRLTRAQADELAAAYQRTTQEAFREVADSLVARQRYAEQIAAQQRAVTAQERLARVARLRYGNGISIYLEVLDAERNLFAAQQQLIALRSADLQNGVSLYIALGGGLKADSGMPAS